MGLMIGSNEKFVGRDEIALVPTPLPTNSWKPVPHVEVIDSVVDVIKHHNWSVINEQYGLARDGQKMFGVLRINKSSSLEWSRCIGIRNSHDKSFSVGLTAGISVMVCSNLAFGGSMVLKRRHTSRMELEDMVTTAIDNLEEQFLTLENVAEDLKFQYVKPDNARVAIVKAAECEVINSSDIVPIFKEFTKPRHEEFDDPTRWSLLNAFTEIAKKYTPARADVCYRGLTKLFGLDGNNSTLFAR